jgi:3-oxoadipate enol-lactonase
MTSATPLPWVEDGPRGAPTVVLANPLGSTSSIWDPMIETLSRDHRVVRFDLRGHGCSPAVSGPYDIADLGGDIVGLLDEVGTTRTSLCGISIGGLGSMWVAANAPERVDRLILCCTAARQGTPAGWTEREALVRRAGMDAVAEGVSGRWVTTTWAAEHPAEMLRLRDMVAATDPTAYAEWCGALGRGDLGRELAGIVAPTLVIGGADDPAVLPAELRALVDAISGARLAIIADAAHNPPLEQPDAMSGLILDHLDKHEG